MECATGAHAATKGETEYTASLFINPIVHEIKRTLFSLRFHR